MVVVGTVLGTGDGFGIQLTNRTMYSECSRRRWQIVRSIYLSPLLYGSMKKNQSNKAKPASTTYEQVYDIILRKPLIKYVEAACENVSVTIIKSNEHKYKTATKTATKTFVEKVAPRRRNRFKNCFPHGDDHLNLHRCVKHID